VAVLAVINSHTERTLKYDEPGIPEIFLLHLLLLLLLLGLLLLLLLLRLLRPCPSVPLFLYVVLFRVLLTV
jgi:hypothetical protein